MVNYQPKITVKSHQSIHHTPYSSFVIAPVHALSIEHVHTSHVMSVIAPICALPVPSVHPSDDEHQEFLDEFPRTNYGDNRKCCKRHFQRLLV